MSGLFDQFNGVPPVGITPGMDVTQQPMAAVAPQAPSMLPSAMSPMQKLLAQIHAHMYGGALGTGASMVGNAITGAMMPNTDGLGSLLSDSDKQHAKTMALLRAGAALSAAGGPHVGTPAPSLMQAIASGLSSGQEGAQQDLGQSLQNKMTGVNAAQQLRILAARQAIGQMFAPRQGDTPQQIASRLTQAYSAYAAVGDTEMMGKLSDVIKEMPQFKGLDIMDIDTGGSKLLLNKATGKPIAEIPKTMSDEARANIAFTHGMQQIAARDREQAHEDTHSYEVTQQKQHEEDSWMRDVKPYADAARIMGTVESALPHTANNPVAQRQVLQGFVQLMMPNATNIRPNALSPYINTMGLSSELSRAVSKLDNGQALSPVQMAQVKHLYQQLKAQRIGEYTTLRKARIGQARAMGLDMANLYDPFADKGIPQSTGRVNPLLQP